MWVPPRSPGDETAVHGCHCPGDMTVRKVRYSPDRGFSLLRRGSLWETFNNIGFGRARGERWEEGFPARCRFFPSPQAYGQETFAVKAAQKRPLWRRDPWVGVRVCHLLLLIFRHKCTDTTAELVSVGELASSILSWSAPESKVWELNLCLIKAFQGHVY